MAILGLESWLLCSIPRVAFLVVGRLSREQLKKSEIIVGSRSLRVFKVLNLYGFCTAENTLERLLSETASLVISVTP